jgi:hypothetical protein
MSLAVADEPAVVHEPAERALPNRASRDHLGALLAGITSYDFDVPAGAGAVADGFGAVAGAGPGFGDCGVAGDRPKPLSRIALARAGDRQLGTRIGQAYSSLEAICSGLERREVCRPLGPAGTSAASGGATRALGAFCSLALDSQGLAGNRRTRGQRLRACRENRNEALSCRSDHLCVAPAGCLRRFPSRFVRGRLAVVEVEMPWGYQVAPPERDF